MESKSQCFGQPNPCRCPGRGALKGSCLRAKDGLAVGGILTSFCLLWLQLSTVPLKPLVPSTACYLCTGWQLLFLRWREIISVVVNTVTELIQPLVLFSLPSSLRSVFLSVFAFRSYRTLQSGFINYWCPELQCLMTVPVPAGMGDGGWDGGLGERLSVLMAVAHPSWGWLVLVLVGLSEDTWGLWFQLHGVTEWF